MICFNLFSDVQTHPVVATPQSEGGVFLGFFVLLC